MQPQQPSLLPDDAVVDPVALALAAAVRGREGHFSELLGRLGEAGAPLAGMAPLWRDFFTAIGAEGWADLPARQARIQRRVLEDGATYNVYADGGQSQRAWPLESLPTLIGPDDWAQIERGVAQRARLLDAVLRDAYGERRLLEEGLLPASLVLGHPQYLRPMHGCRPAGDVFLHVAAFDLVRGPEGRWWVAAQRTQAPSGLGYLLENRLIVAQQFPIAFRELRVQRLASSFLGMLQGLMRLSPAGERSRVVLLTPGPANETYFEQVFLARYLGIALVEGADLTVRANRVYLKTLHGLERVHVVLRRVDDEYLDPLELRPDSALGVAGLLQALRAGEVVVANAPGAGWLESPGLAAFWPAVAERLLGEPLALPAVTTWWCGEEAVWQDHRARLGDFIAVPTFAPGPGRPGLVPQRVAALDARARAALLQRIDDDPAACTLQAPMRGAETPVWREGRLLARSAVLRVFAVADGRGGWRVVPGGMARVAAEGDGGANPWLSMQHGHSSADTWVQTGGEVDPTSLLPRPLSAADLASWHRSVTSRSAENLFWLGRYSERAENCVRLARLTLEALTGSLITGASAEVLGVLDTLARHHGLVGTGVPTPQQSVRVFERALVHALGDAQGATSVAYNLQALMRCAQALRERLSPEHWKLIREVGEHFDQHLRAALDTAAAEPLADVMGVLARAATHLAAITGAQTDRMTRDDGWRLLSVGRQIERLDFHAHALALGIERGLHRRDEGFALLLGLFDSTITYRAQFQARRELPPLLHLLVHDTDNPRALAWVARTMRDRFIKLSRHDAAWAQEVAATLPRPEDWPLELISTPDDAGGHAPLITLLAQCGQQVRGLSDALGQRLFSHVGPADRMVWQ
ncbi:circularly permuted type 2 ATP-grasp protein [Ideonella sp. 4Y16]|uniref:Circularly permuted type 2 ATP-grasp protein n=1 Tax=Ideonella alba TaxID=2824118 RepID=A0A940YG80_9BURK|nr:circularly permuted type 2 ATP-grasp protein [Ideonella alba]MBQ0931925.1 circularly permuted type 2 ATP-grasp protein [Ideonella alba]MBQ0942566.1 circularly permuted type 2 ATP-grasp protein [Ideonella alba]